MRCRRWPTLPRPLGRSTIGAVGLNDRVRDGNGCGPYALIASVFGHSVVESSTRRGGARRAEFDARQHRTPDRPIRGSGLTISDVLTAEDGRSWTTNPVKQCAALLAVELLG